MNNAQKAQTMERRLALRYYFTTDAEALHAELEEIQKKAKQRTLSHADLEIFLETIEEMIELANNHDLSLYKLSGRMDGGAVAYRYDYSADSTFFSVSNGKISVYRSRSARRSGGRGQSFVMGFTGLDKHTKKRLKALGWTGTGGTWRP